MNARVKILAMTAAYNENDDAVPAQSLSDTLVRDRSEYARYQACQKPLVSPEKAYLDYERPLVVALVVADAGAEIHYTLDGSVPTMGSAKYTAPISLNQSAVLNAITFDKVKLSSAMATGYFSKSLPVKSIQYLVQPVQRRGGPGGMAAAASAMLIDLVRGSAEVGDRNWQAFDKDLDVILDMGEVKTLQEITLGCLENNSARVFLSASVEISVSTDNKDYKVAAADSLTVPEKAQGPAAKNLTYDLKKIQGQYIHVKAKNIGALPKWHPNASAPNAAALMNFDEIIVR
jgi:hexosaminidase